MDCTNARAGGREGKKQHSPGISHSHGERHEGVIAEEFDSIVEDQQRGARSLQGSDASHRRRDGLEDAAQKLDCLVGLDHRHAPLLCFAHHLCVPLSCQMNDER